MKPDWDKLSAEYANEPGILVAEVDCQNRGRNLCARHKISSFPTLKYGDPDELKEYGGDRSYPSLSAFAKDKFKIRTWKMEFKKWRTIVENEFKLLKAEIKDVVRTKRKVVLTLVSVFFLVGVWVGMVSTYNCCPKREPVFVVRKNQVQDGALAHDPDKKKPE